MTTERQAAQHAVDVLNRIHKSDPTVLPTLIAYRIPCNETLADDLTVQVGPMGESARLRASFNENFSEDEQPCEVGLLGIINGIFGIRERSQGWIAAVYDDNRVLTHFALTGGAA